ncbi:GNAT family N-acetyltransferase [Lacticaseibacillus daqingensis]|uniref:GNAT family N-acetyltransferase n=1 Tax=Lacticaseibacillus daqingensis TaxID=2486014 RepID=UPI000F790E75|nr:GNAT family N-acetyltransferase [Lacticaseibacillus daqingensis]
MTEQAQPVTLEWLTPPTAAQLDQLMTIWLTANEQAHDFVPAGYWRANVAAVRAALPEAQLLVARQRGRLIGFAGVQDHYLAGLFVTAAARGNGVGHQLMTALKDRYSGLTLSVYDQNTGAVRFYAREGFAVLQREEDTAVHQPALVMGWRRAD